MTAIIRVPRDAYVEAWNLVRKEVELVIHRWIIDPMDFMFLACWA